MRSIGVPLVLALSAVPTAACADAPSDHSIRLAASAQSPASLLPRLPLQSDAYAPRPRGPFIASMAISPNAALGLGRFSMPPRRRVSLQDQPISLDAKKVRRAAVGIALRF